MSKQKENVVKKPKVVETPLMKQYFEIKKQYPDAVLLFRVGDFYETFAEDAVFTSKALNIVLTKRANGSASSVELAGFPYHALDSYLHKLVKAGGKVAICEQLEDPKLTKKIVKRGITELITPGVALSDKLLDYGKNNFLACIYIQEPSTGLAFLDISTGEFYTTQGPWSQIHKLIASFSPSEVLLCREQKRGWEEKVGSTYYTTYLDEWVFKSSFAEEILLNHFKVKSLKGFGIDDLKNGQIAAGACLHYLNATKHEKSDHVSKIQRLVEDNIIWLDPSTIRNLELLEPAQSGGKDTSLLAILKRSITPMGTRLLRRVICMPLQNREEIEHRLDFVQEIMNREELLELVEEEFELIGDLERLLSKVASLRANPRDVLQIADALQAIQRLAEHIKQLNKKPNSLSPWEEWASKIEPCIELQKYITSHVHPQAPMSLSKGMVIADGVSEELDKLRQIAFSGKDYLAELQQREAKRTGISSLKLGFNSVFGYYLEVTHLNKDKVPENWVRKQTLTTGERYITEELKEYEQKVLGAQEKITGLEAALYDEVLHYILPYMQCLQANAQAIAFADVMYSFAVVAQEYNYVRPKLTDDTDIEIEEGRHPVIERNLPDGESYVPNSLCLSENDCQIMMITGPNMSGKSAVLRQTALIVLMAQMGSFVPASGAKIGLVDKVFTRVGASDNIASGESTFMVEMNETANILNNITSRSLVLLDEIGRGTSTYDGISIAWAIAEYLHENANIRSKVLFATHYHELNQMAEKFERIKNYHISVLKKGEEFLFLRKLVAGGSEHSFGIHVAQMAGMPKNVVDKAEEILQGLEKNRKVSGKFLDRTTALDLNVPHESTTSNNLCDSKTLEQGSYKPKKAGKSALEQPPKAYQLSFIQLEDPLIEKIKDEILNIDINTLTPIEALNRLNEIKKLIKKD